jgi:hypothetical protein
MTWLDFDLSVGTIYPSPKDAIVAIFGMTNARGESFLVKKTKEKRLIATWHNKDCYFRFCILTVARIGKITVNKPHSCPPEMHSHCHSTNSVCVFA